MGGGALNWGFWGVKLGGVEPKMGFLEGKMAQNGAFWGQNGVGKPKNGDFGGSN